MADSIDTLSAAIEKLSREVSEGFADHQEYTADAYSKLQVEMNTGLGHVRTEMNTGFSELRTEMNTMSSELRTEMNTSSSQLRTAVNTSLDQLRTEMNTGFGYLRNDMSASFTRLERIERKLDQFIETQIQTNQIMDRRLRLVEE